MPFLAAPLNFPIILSFLSCCAKKEHSVVDDDPIISVKTLKDIS